MGYALSCLVRNLRAGLRLALFLRVDRLAFRIDLAQVLLLLGLSAVIDFFGDWWLAEAPRTFSIEGAGTEVHSAGLFLLGAAVIALLNRQRALALALPVLAFAALPVVQITHYALVVFAARGEPPIEARMLDQLFMLWIVMVLIRSVFVSFVQPPAHVWLRAIGGGLLLASPIWYAGMIFPNDPWWRGDDHDPGEGMTLSAGSEAVMAAQSYLMQDVLDALRDGRPGQADLYFVGFAPYGRDVAYRDDVESAQRAMDAKWGTFGRSLVLANSPESLLTLPFATATNLRETLNEFAAIMDPEDDVVMVYLAGRGAPGSRLVAELPPLSLVELAPAGLKQLLDDAGIRWRIIVVAACHSGGYLKPLEDDHTLIITSGGTGDGRVDCVDGDDVRFGQALFRDGLGKGEDFGAAFDAARARVTVTEPGGGPQQSVGAAMADKLKVLRKGETSGIMVNARPQRDSRLARAGFALH